MNIEEIKIGMILQSKKTKRVVIVLEIDKDNNEIKCFCTRWKAIYNHFKPANFEKSEIKEW